MSEVEYEGRKLYNITDTQDPNELLDQVRKDKNLTRLQSNIENFIKPGEKQLPAPFVIKLPTCRDGKTYNLLGGHKRSTVALRLGIPIKVWLMDLTQQ